MNGLFQERCVPCRRGAPRVTDSGIELLHPVIPNWEVIEDGPVKKLHRSFRFRDFRQAMDFTMEVAKLAEEEGHHPKLVTEWGRVTIDWWTHTIRGLHRNDFVMAAKTDYCFENTGADAQN